MSLDEQISALMAMLAKEKRALEEEKVLWANMETKLDTSNLADPITLNVGGTHFALPLKDLTSKPGSYFAAMFSGRWPAKADKHGAYFINRSPAVFGYVADHLRGRDISLDLLDLSPSKRAILKGEAEFFGLDSLADALKHRHMIEGELVFITDITQYVTFSGNGRTATKTTGGNNWNCTVVGPEFVWPSKGYSEVRVKHTFGTINTMIGLAPFQAIIAAAASSSAPYASNGWYLCTSGGSLYGQTGQSNKAYTKNGVPNGAVVAVRLHDDGRVSFAVDGIDFGTAFVIPTHQQCCVAVMMNSTGTTVELLE